MRGEAEYQSLATRYSLLKIYKNKRGEAEYQKSRYSLLNIYNNSRTACRCSTFVAEEESPGNTEHHTS